MRIRIQTIAIDLTSSITSVHPRINEDNYGKLRFALVKLQGRMRWRACVYFMYKLYWATNRTSIRHIYGYYLVLIFNSEKMVGSD